MKDCPEASARGVAVSRAIVYKIEVFKPTESFNRAKHYKTRFQS